MKCFYDGTEISHQKFAFFNANISGLKWPQFTTSIDANKPKASWIFTLFSWNYVILVIPLQKTGWNKTWSRTSDGFATNDGVLRYNSGCWICWEKLWCRKHVKRVKNAFCIWHFFIYVIKDAFLKPIIVIKGRNYYGVLLHLLRVDENNHNGGLRRLTVYGAFQKIMPCHDLGRAGDSS